MYKYTKKIQCTHLFSTISRILALNKFNFNVVMQYNFVASYQTFKIQNIYVKYWQNIRFSLILKIKTKTQFLMSSFTACLYANVSL